MPIRSSCSPSQITRPPSSPSYVYIHFFCSFRSHFCHFVKSLFACAAAPLASLDRLPHVVFWVWFHLLHFNLSNQTLKPEEDEYNKPDRPLPAKRLSWETAKKLRWASVPCCFALSACYSLETLYASIVLCGLTIVYDELGYASGHWFTRNFLNGVGFASFDVGSMLVAGMS